MSKSQLISTFKQKKATYSIRISNHAMQRLEERNISYNAVCEDILSLTFAEFKNLQSKNQDIMFINLLNNYSIVFCFDKNTLIIKTVINKSNNIEVYGDTYVRILDNN